jgi:hypothetical protein
MENERRSAARQEYRAKYAHNSSPQHFIDRVADAMRKRLPGGEQEERRKHAVHGGNGLTRLIITAPQEFDGGASAFVA